MNRNGGFFGNLKAGFRRFMEGRYGSDKLNMAILVVALVMGVAHMLIPFTLVKGL